MNGPPFHWLLRPLTYYSHITCTTHTHATHHTHTLTAHHSHTTHHTPYTPHTTPTHHTPHRLRQFSPHTPHTPHTTHMHHTQYLCNDHWTDARVVPSSPKYRFVNKLCTTLNMVLVWWWVWLITGRPRPTRRRTPPKGPKGAPAAPCAASPPLLSLHLHHYIHVCPLYTVLYVRMSDRRNIDMEAH